MESLLPHESGFVRLLLVVGIALGAHAAVVATRWAGMRVVRLRFHPSLAKVKTISGLVMSVAVFAIYFGATGIGLAQFDISLTGYIATASIIGLAVGFGSQMVVQDVIGGLTVIFGNVFDVGDMVQIGDQVGLVRKIGMRSTMLENAMGAEVTIPNRAIANVVYYPRGYLRCLVDVTLLDDAEKDRLIEECTRATVQSIVEQFPGILRAEPELLGRLTTSTGKAYLRTKFRLWPGREIPVDRAFRQELVATLAAELGRYSDWMVSVNYEVERRR